MAKLMKAVAWRRLERPYTRKSKFREKSYVRAMPQNRIVKFVMGDPTKKFPYKVLLKSKADIQLRHNALESARKSSNKLLEGKIGITGYHFKIRVYPHHALRNNPLAAGAGADRMSTGMARSFGKVVGLAARVKKGQTVFEVGVNKQHLQLARDAMVRAKNKLPCSCSIEVLENN
jgi:large subunit ribosomal protein L10e